jgi:hypothetical protein
MALITKLKQPIKKLRWQMRRGEVARRYGAKKLQEMPIVIGNAMPKSGSHLLHQVLLGLTKLGPFVDPGMHPLSRSADNRNLSDPEVLNKISKLKAGDISYAYLHAKPEYQKALTTAKMATFFIHRDPRDVIVSHVFYATDIYMGHGMHEYYKSLKSMEERINAAIEGVNKGDTQLSPISVKYDMYLPWLMEQEVHSLSYEGLMLAREDTLGYMLDFLASREFVPDLGKEQAVSVLSEAIKPSESGTFRKGIVGDWKKHFTEENKENFKANCGDLLQKLSYEKGANW